MSRACERTRTGEEDQRVLEIIAAQLGTTLHHAQLLTDLQHRTVELEALHETAVDLLERRSLPDLLDAVARRAAQLAGTENGFIYMVDDDGASATAVAGTGGFSELIGRRITRDRGISGRAWERREAVTTDDYGTYDRAIPAYSGTAVGRGPMVAIPLIAHRGVIGILGLGRPDGPPFGDDESIALRRFGQLATLAMESVRLTVAAEDELRRRTTAEEALRAAEQRYRALVEQLPAALYLHEVRAGVPSTVYVSPQIEAIVGYTPDHFDGPLDRWTEIVHEDDRAGYLAELDIGDDRGPFRQEFRMITRDGRTIWVHDEWVAIGPADGPVEYLQGILTDVSERHRLAHELSQAVKMEAVGRLAGGIAHDFNNLLTAIGGYATLLSDDLDPDDRRRGDADAIVATADRAAGLVRQLLEFSRPRMEAPMTVELNAVVSEVDSLIRRLLGADIEFATVLGAGVGHIRMDPSQLEQVLVNLAVNARDAMPEGGVLAVSTAREVVEPDAPRPLAADEGPSVVLTVRDTGHGMDEAVLAHIFEPFFTTKEPGKGTGLGLSTVYGIVTAGRRPDHRRE